MLTVPRRDSSTGAATTRTEATVTIDAPPERVWEHVGDLDGVPEWVHARCFGFEVGTAETLSVSEESVGVGTTYRERGRLGPLTLESEW